MQVSKLRNYLLIWIVTYSIILAGILIIQSYNNPIDLYVNKIWSWFLISNLPVYLLIYLSFFRRRYQSISIYVARFIILLYIFYGFSLISFPILASYHNGLANAIYLFQQPNYTFVGIIALYGISFKPLIFKPKEKVENKEPRYINIESNHDKTKLHRSGVKIFISYAHVDEMFMLTLNKHLSTLKNQNEIETWDDRKISPGDNWKGSINDAVNSAQIFLLLISADFLASEYCNDVELKRAKERHEAGECTIIPIILRDCDWKASEISQFQALPTASKAISKWNDQDSAFLDVVQGIRKVIFRDHASYQ